MGAPLPPNFKSEWQPAAPEWEILLEAARPRADAQRFCESVSRPIDWACLVALAEEHSLLPHLAQRLLENAGTLIPPEFRVALLERHRSQAVFTLGLLAEMLRLLECLAAAKIEHLVIKGPVLAVRCYGDPGARQYGDLDLIVRTKDIERCTHIMLELGYQPRISVAAIRTGKIPGEYVFRRAGTIVEFHAEHTFRYYPRGFPVDSVFARKTCVTIDQHQVPALSAEDELILVCIHAAKHLWERLAWVADVAALLSNGSGVDWHRVMPAAQEVGAERMLRVGLRLASEMLGAAIPDEFASYVRADTGATQLAKQIAHRLPRGDAANPGILGRAVYRVRMRGGLLSGAAYLLRLSLSPTEDDWSADAEQGRSRVIEAISRPFRLARKYRRGVTNRSLHL